LLSFLLFVTILILNNLLLFLDINAFSIVLDNRLRFFNNNIRTTISTKDVKTIISSIVIVVLERFIIRKINTLYFVL